MIYTYRSLFYSGIRDNAFEENLFSLAFLTPRTFFVYFLFTLSLSNFTKFNRFKVWANSSSKNAYSVVPDYK